MSRIISQEQVTLPLLATILDDAGVECSMANGQALYITSEVFNAWLSIEVRWPALVWSTYMPIRERADAAEASDLAHRANLSSPFLSYVADGSRLNASAYHIFRGFLARRSLLSLVRTLPTIFSNTIKEQDSGHLLIAPSEEQPPLILN